MSKIKERITTDTGYIPRKVLEWRKKQAPGTIMKPSTFEEIKEAAKKQYGINEEKAAKVAGKAYWETVKAKYKSKKKLNMPKEFNQCVKNGGRVRTKVLKGGKYIHICFLNGKSYSGEVKRKTETGYTKK